MAIILLLQREMKAAYSMLNNPLKTLTKKEWLLWLVSLTVVILSNLATNDLDLLTLISALLGVTALIFCRKGKCLGAVSNDYFLHFVWYHFFPFSLLGRNDHLPRNDFTNGRLVSNHLASKSIRRK